MPSRLSDAGIWRPSPSAIGVWMGAVVVLVATSLVWFATAPALAHPWGPPPTAVVSVEGSEVVIEWRAEFDDGVALVVALGLLHPSALDWDWDGLSEKDHASVGDALSQAPALKAYLLESIQVLQDGAVCQGGVHPNEDFLTSGARVVYRCPYTVEGVSVRITMLHSLHEAYRTIAYAGGAHPRQQVFTATDPEHYWTFGVSGGTTPDRSSFVARWSLALAGVLAAGAVIATWRRRRPAES
jgi:hypothetical protein